MRNGEKYRSYRKPCTYPVRLRIGPSTLEGKTLNVMNRGLRVEAPGLDPAQFPPGRQLHVVIDLEAFPAEVAWARTGQVGLRLLAPLGTRTLERMQKDRRGVRVSGIGHHGFREL